MQIDDMGEFELIGCLKKVIPRMPKNILGIGDDTALLPFTKTKHLLFTTDMMAQDVHFDRRMGAEDIGHKALACNISDIAAMGGLPTYAVVSLGLPKNTKVSYVEGIYRGIGKVAQEYRVAIVGGDTIKTDKIIINIALLGEVDKKNVVTRAGARAGDWIFVTGQLGGSLKSGRHLTFTPQVEKSQFLVKHYKPSAMIDISDGLAGDLNHILYASGVGAKLWPDAIPMHKGVQLTQALCDGEDYELLFTLAPQKASKLMQWQFKNKLFHFYPIGEITNNKKQKINVKSFTHF